MNFTQALDHADFSVIEGDRKSGKLTFFFHILNNITNNKHATIITSANQSVFLKKINIFKESISEFKDLNDHLEFFFLKEGWKELLKRFDHDFLLKDIGRIVEKMPGDNLFIDNLGEMFDLHEQTEIPKFVKDLHNLGQIHKKNIFVSLSKNSDSYQVTRNILLNYLDIIVAVKPSKNIANIRLIDVPVSNYPLEKTHFEIKLENKELTLSKRTDPLPSPSEPYPFIHTQQQQALAPIKVEKIKDQHNIVLISDCENVTKFHHYILEHQKKIQLTVIKTPENTDIETLKEADIIIFNSNTNISQGMDFSIAEIAKEHNLNGELFYLCNREHSREQEKISASLNGYREFFNIRTRIINYVMALEKSLNFNFYSRIICQKHEEFYIENDKQEFKKQVKKSIQNRLFFTLFSFSYDQYTFTPETMKATFRDGDFAIIDHKKSSLILYCNSAQKEDSNIILRKIKKIDPSIRLQKSTNSFDIFFNNTKIL